MQTTLAQGISQFLGVAPFFVLRDLFSNPRKYSDWTIVFYTACFRLSARNCSNLYRYEAVIK